MIVMNTYTGCIPTIFLSCSNTKNVTIVWGPIRIQFGRKPLYKPRIAFVWIHFFIASAGDEYLAPTPSKITEKMGLADYYNTEFLLLVFVVVFLVLSACML